MIDEPEQNEPAPNDTPDKMTEEILEKLRAAVEIIHEVSGEMAPPMDPRAFGLLEMAADLLLEQIETGRLYYSDDSKEASDIEEKLKQVQGDLSLLKNTTTPTNNKSLGNKMADDIQKYFEQSDLLPDEEV